MIEFIRYYIQIEQTVPRHAAIAKFLDHEFGQKHSNNDVRHYLRLAEKDRLIELKHGQRPNYKLKI